MPGNEALYLWLIHSAIVSLLVLAAGSVAILLCRGPARRVWVIELILTGCLVAPWLGVIPGYPRLGIGWRAAASLHREEAALPASTDRAERMVGPSVIASTDDLPVLPQTVTHEAAPRTAEAPSHAFDLASWIVNLYVVGVALGLGWWLVGLLGLVKIMRTTRPAPSRCRVLLTQIAGQRASRVRLLVSRRVRQAFAFAFGRRVIVLPEDLCSDDQTLRWSLAHEWTHIERHDFRAWLTAGLVRVLFFYHPLVWWLRRQLRLSQDFLADDRAARQTPQPEDYAEFLTACAAAGSLRPVLAGLGMGFSKSELYRRVVMLVQNRSLESRPPRLWTLFATCTALVLVGAVAALTASPQAAAEGVTGSAGAASPGEAQMSRTSTPNAGNAVGRTPNKPAKAKITLESSGFSTTWSGGGIDEETEKLIKAKKYEFVKTFDSRSGEKQYVYRFTYPDGRRVNRNFSLPLDNVISWADYQKKQAAQREQRNERISQALTSGHFRLLNLEVMQIHLCRDVASGKEFKVQRIQRPDGTEIALPRPDYGAIPPSVHQTSWQDHLQAIRDGKRNLLSLETVNSYTYEMTADDGTRAIFNYGGNEPLDVLVKRPAGKAARFFYSPTTKSTETVMGMRPQGNCSIAGKVIAEATRKPVAGARMYLHYNVTHGSIFMNTDSEGKFEIKDIPKGPFSLCSSHTGGYQDAAYSPDGIPGPFPPFSLKDGEHRTGIVLKIKEACRIFGKIMDENGKVPESRTWEVLAWLGNDGKGYHTQHAMVNHADGSYVIDGLSNKPVYVMAIDWRAAKEGSAWPAIYYPSSFSRADAKQVVFDKSRHVDDINITLRKAGGIVIEGIVRDEAGKPVPEAFVVVHRRDMLFDFDTAYTDAEGRYQIQGLGAGSFLVHVDAAHRGFVRTRTPVDVDKASGKVQRDFTLHRGVLISGKFVDEKSQNWEIGDSYAYAAQVSKDRPARNQRELNEGNFSLTDFQNKHRPENAEKRFPGTFLLGEGDYDCDQAVFPTTSTFIIQGMMPGHTIIGLSPNKENQKVVKILYEGRDILKSGIDTKAGDEIKDITIVVGTDRTSALPAAKP